MYNAGAVRFRYFIRRVGANQLHCLRVPEDDPRIPDLVKRYDPICWNTTVWYSFKPTPEQEAFEIKMRSRTWDRDVVIEDVGQKEEQLR